ADRSLKTFKKHDKRVNRVMWSPHSSDTFASCSDDSLVILWNAKKTDNRLGGAFFKHIGHRTRVADIAWHPDDAFSNTIASVSTSLVTSNDNNKIKPSLVQGLLIGVIYSGALQLEPKPDWKLNTPSWLG
ncbi:24764_t:CDS:2, partial [Gigaspora rosea]